MANDDVMHQGKTISQWEKDFNGMFSREQLLKLVRGGCDLQKMLVSGLDEAENDIDDKQLFKGEEFFFNEDDSSSLSPKIEFVTYDNDGNEVARSVLDNNEVTSVSLEYLSNCMDDLNDAAKAFPNSIHQTAMIFVDDKPLSTISSVRKAQIRRLIDTMSMNESTLVDEEAALSEDASIPNVEATTSEIAGIMTIGDLAKFISGKFDAGKKLMFKANGNPYEMSNAYDKHGVVVIELVPVVANGKLDESAPWEDSSGITDEQWKEAYDWFEANGFKIHDSDEGGFTFTKPINGKYFYDGKDGYDLYLKMKDEALNEGRNWRTGGYGGYGRSYRSYGEIGAPRGKDISWFAVSDLDPKARGKMNDWRVGPSNFKFVDLIYPERDYKVGTTVLRSKHLKAGEESGVKYIAIPSYLDAIWNNDEAAIELLKSLGIPLDLTFGYKPGEDFSSTYVIKTA